VVWLCAARAELVQNRSCIPPFFLHYLSLRMDFFCLPLIFGCSTSVSPDSGQALRVCPNCHNVSVTSGKKRTWFELCCVPVIPMSSSHVWICSICQWTAKTNAFEPQLPGTGPPPGVYQMQHQYPMSGQYPHPYPPQGAYQQGQPAYGQAHH